MIKEDRIAELKEVIDQKQLYGVDQHQPRKRELQLFDNDELAEHIINAGYIRADEKAITLTNELSILSHLNVGDVVKVKALCEVVDSYYCQRLDKKSCPFARECEHIICESCNESEFTTRISSIQNCGDGWRIHFDNMLVEARPLDYGKSFWKIGDGPKLETFCLRDQVDFLKRFIRGEWVDCFIIQKLLDIDFSTGLQMFEFSRTAQWNPAAYNGQKVRTCFRIKLKKEDPEI